MDPLTLAANVVTLLAIKLGERVGEKLGEAAGDAAGRGLDQLLGRLYRLVKAKVAGKPEVQASLERLERGPDDDAARDQLAGGLGSLVSTDPGFAEELRRLVGEAHRVGGVALTQVMDAGAVAIQGNVIQHGTYNAGRDLHLG